MIRTEHGTADLFKIRKGVQQAQSASSLFNFYAEHIMWNARLDELQAGTKIAGRNINNLRSSDDTTVSFLAEREEDLKSLLIKVKEESETAGLKCTIQKMKIMASNLITSQQREGEKVEAVTGFI